MLPAVGYSSPDQSHFTSRHYWEVGALQPNAVTGWMGRLLDVIGTPDNPLQGLSLDGTLSPALATALGAGRGDRRPLLRHLGRGRLGRARGADVGRRRRARPLAHGRKDAGRKLAGLAASQAMQLKAQLDPFSGEEIAPPVAYPTGEGEWFGESLARSRRCSPPGCRSAAPRSPRPGDFDTHDNQAESFAADLQLAADSIAAFQADLEARGLADRVITLVWSEFGRRPEENDSGTDHGAAGVGFVIGTGVRGPDDRRVPRPRAARRRRQPAQHLRLPRPLLLDHRAVVRRRRRRRDPRRRGFARPALIG